MPLIDIKKPSRLNVFIKGRIHASVVLDARREMGENGRAFRSHQGWQMRLGTGGVNR